MDESEVIRRAELMRELRGRDPAIDGTEVIGLEDGGDLPGDVTATVTVEDGDVVVWLSLPDCPDMMIWCNGEWSEN